MQDRSQGLNVGPTPTLCVHTDGSGRYRVTVAEAGHFVVEFAVPPHSSYIARTFYGEKYSKAEASVLTIEAGSTTTGIDVQLHEGGRITGTVTDALTGLPVEAVEVCAQGTRADKRDHARADRRGGGRGLRRGQRRRRDERQRRIYAHPSGQPQRRIQGFVLSSLRDGLDFFPQWYNDRESEFESDPVDVPLDHTTSGINAALIEAGQIAGSVTDAHTGQGLAGISACASNRVVYEPRCATTEADGSYKLPGLPAGAYTVEFYSNSNEYFTQYYNDWWSVRD